MAEEEKKGPTAAEKNRRTILKTHHVAGKALELIVQHRLPAVPNTLAVWYAYVGKTNKELVGKLDAALERSGDVPLQVINHLYETCLAKDPQQEQRFDRIGEEFQKEMASVMSLVQDTITGNNAYSSALDKTEKTLPDAVTPEKIRDVVTTLVKQNREVKQMADTLNDGLKQSQSEITQLNDQLSKARAVNMQDKLTGLANRHSFDEKLTGEIDSALKNGTHLCLVMAELDDFGKINDEYGHQVADGVLQNYANLIVKNIKGQDTAARYSATEFAFILPQTNLEGAAQLVKRLSKELEESWLVVASTREAVGNVTASFGISMLRPGIDMAKLILRAEEKLADAKGCGGNKIKMDLSNAEAA